MNKKDRKEYIDNTVDLEHLMGILKQILEIEEMKYNLIHFKSENGEEIYGIRINEQLNGFTKIIDEINKLKNKYEKKLKEIKNADIR